MDLKSLRSIVPTKDSIPILRHVLLDRGSAYLTNLTQWATVKFPLADGLEQCCVPFEQLTAFIDRVDGDIKVVHEGPTVKLSSGRPRASLPTLPAEDFPNLQHVTDGERITLACADLARMSHAIGRNDARIFLQGVSVRGETIAVTDGHRVVERPIASGSMDTGIILPYQFVDLILKMKVETVDLICTEKAATWRTDDGSMFSTLLLVGNFPDTDRIMEMARSSPLKGVWPASEFARALSLVELSGTPFVDVEGGKFMSRGPGGEYETEIEYDGDVLQARFTTAYLQDVARNSEDDVEFRFKSANEPFLFNDDEVLMPVRTVKRESAGA